MLFWNSTQYTLGFSHNPELTWDVYFFLKHFTKIKNENDCSYISANITDSSVVDLLLLTLGGIRIYYQKNKVVYDNYDFVRQHLDKINGNAVVLNCSSELIEEYFDILDISSMMLSDIAVQSKVTDCVSVDFIKANIKCNWDWRKVTRRVYNILKLILLDMIYGEINGIGTFCPKTYLSMKYLITQNHILSSGTGDMY